MTDFDTLYQNQLLALAAETREREWELTMQAVRDRDLPIIAGVVPRVVPTWEDDVLPRFRRWDVIAQRFHFGDWARQAYLMEWE